MTSKPTPLVSIGVITYCSSKYVIETLESIKAQTYPNIELIISDDCSSDNTIEICRNWIFKNASRFLRTDIVTTPINTGLSANCNRLIKTCKGDYVKLIAGDDTLMPSCIADFLNYVKNNNSDIVFSGMRPFGPITDPGVISCKDLTGVFNELSEKERLIMLTHENFLPAPCSFIKCDLFKRIGLFDESIPFIEDWPFWLKTLSRGGAINYLNKVTVNYRVHSNSVSQTTKTHISEVFKDSRKKAVKFACETGSKFGFFEKCYYGLLWLSYQRKRKILKYAKLLNLLNPFAYKVYFINKKYKKLLNE